MSNSPITIRFTDEIYATRFDVSKTLGTNLIDPMWNEIVKYRRTMKHELTIYDVSNVPYFITLTNKNVQKNQTITNLFNRFTSEYSSILGGNISKSAFKKEMNRLSLRYIARLNGIEVNDLSLDKVIENKPYEATHDLLARYIRIVKSLTDDKIDENFIANSLLTIRGESELTSFYRMNDIETAASKYLFSKEYEAVPSNDIEGLMNNLIQFLNDDNETVLNKIVSILYMFQYIKPFEEYNNEMCLILIKKVAGVQNRLVPIEPILSAFNVEKLYKEIQKTHDLTYLYIPVSESLEKILMSSLDRIVQLNGHDLRQTYLVGDDANEFKKEFKVEPKPEVIAPKVEFEEKEVVKKEETKVSKPQIILEVEEKPKEIILDEKELRAKANNMLESDPYLKKSQAHFYVRHCTKGKFYTIQQFKKEEGCVYETARTSMDNLAKLGYYRREQIKNKFVYTPIER